MMRGGRPLAPSALFDGARRIRASKVLTKLCLDRGQRSLELAQFLQKQLTVVLQGLDALPHERRYVKPRIVDIGRRGRGIEPRGGESGE